MITVHHSCSASIFEGSSHHFIFQMAGCLANSERDAVVATRLKVLAASAEFGSKAAPHCASTSLPIHHPQDPNNDKHCLLYCNSTLPLLKFSTVSADQIPTGTSNVGPSPCL